MLKASLGSSTLIYVLLSAVCFAGWNLLARKAGVNQYWLTLVVCIATLLVVMLQSVPKVINMEISRQALLILLIAGTINGLGFIFYGQALDSGAVNLSVLLPILFGVMVLFSYFGGVWFFNEPTNSTKMIGVGFTIFGIYLINQ